MINLDYKDKKILITGGLGFIGSNLAVKLVEEGAKVTIMDSKIQGQGANEFNILPIRNKIQINYSDIRNKEEVLENVRDQDIIFNLAAQIVNNPYEQSGPKTNQEGQVNLLESCKEINPDCRIVFAGSRLMYGKVDEKNLPVKETLPLRPLVQYAKDKVDGEKLHQEYFKKHRLDTLCFRITNPYGPRGQMKHAKYGIVNWFIRQALENKEIKIFGDGSRFRDYIYVGDLVDAFLMGGLHPSAKGQIYNVGSGIPTSLDDLAKTITRVIGSGKILHVPLPDNEKDTETGNFYADVSKIKRELGWKTKTDLEEGIKKTTEFYKKNLSKYI
jgi:nucleoside-diphosphate-sugar epimerase